MKISYFVVNNPMETSYLRYILPAFLRYYWILGIMSQTLREIEEFSDVECYDLTSEKELASLFSSRKLFQMIVLPEV